MSKINIDEFKNYYINHSTKSTKKYFGLTDKPFNELLAESGLILHDRATNIKLTNIEKYGVENVFQLKDIKDKSRSTKLEKYGNENFNNSKLREETCLQRYGTKSASGNSEIQEKIKETNLQKFGVDNPFKDRELMNNSYISKYGSIEAFNIFCEEQRKKSLQETYGVTNASQIPGTRDLAEYKRRATYIENSVNSANSNPNTQFYTTLVDKGFTGIEKEFTIKNRSYDFKVNNFLIEINPFATHNSTWSPFGDKWVKSKSYHYEKSRLARDNGYRCICIWDWDDNEKIVNSLLSREKIMARKCILKEVDISEAKDFINHYHFQGYAKDSIRIGLYYNNELVSIMTFDKPRYNKNYQYELVRYCSSKNVTGGAEKLFKNFLAVYNPKSIISYCDLSKFNGETYSKLGFKLDNISIGKHWFNTKTGQHITDNLLRQRGFDQLFGTDYGKGTSNEDLMIQAGFVEIYDCGQARYTQIFTGN